MLEHYIDEKAPDIDEKANISTKRHRYRRKNEFIDENHQLIDELEIIAENFQLQLHRTQKL